MSGIVLATLDGCTLGIALVLGGRPGALARRPRRPTFSLSLVIVRLAQNSTPTLLLHGVCECSADHDIQFDAHCWIDGCSATCPSTCQTHVGFVPFYLCPPVAVCRRAPWMAAGACSSIAVTPETSKIRRAPECSMMDHAAGRGRRA